MYTSASMKKTIIVSVEGNIGSGKSTLTRYLQEKYMDDYIKNGGMYKTDADKTLSPMPNIVFLQEPVDAWSRICDDKGVTILEHFYQDQEKYAFAFQMMAYISRLNLLKTTIEEHPGAIIVTERSLYTDKHVFMRMLNDGKQINAIERAIYEEWFDSFTDGFKLDGVVYVSATPEKCKDRVENRSRDGENTISLDYLHKCHDYHEDMLKEENRATYIKPKDNAYGTILTLDGNQTFGEVCDIWCQDVFSYIYSIMREAERPVSALATNK